MNWIRLILKNLRFYRKQYLAILAGVVISTTVLTGALIVGDSVRYSLTRLTDIRLGKIRYVLQTNDRFFRQELADELSVQTQLQVAPVLQAGGIAINSDKNMRINQVRIVGIDDRFGKFWDQPLLVPGTDQAIISRNVAGKLNLKQGDDLLLRIQKQGKAPSNAPFVSEKMPSVSIRMKVIAIAEDIQMGRFSLKKNQTAPYNIFLSLKQLASLLELSGQANLLLTADEGNSESMIPLLDSAVRTCWKPADVGLIIKKLPLSGMFQITSDRIFFDDSTAKAILSAIPGCESILTYLVNSISSGTNSTPYSFATAASESFLKQPLGKSQIIINDWLACDLDAVPGDSVTLRYFLMGPMRSLREDSTRFVVKSVIPLNSDLCDRGLMPDFPGMTDAANCRDWETGAAINMKKIRDKDEQYWKDYQGTPKAFIAIGSGQQIWNNSFGNQTSFRFNALETDMPWIEQSLMSKLNPTQYGMFFSPVYKEGQLAAQNSTDFGELFLSLSFFILFSALLLTAMLFFLLAQSRMAETGILSAMGFRKRYILGILTGEAFLVTIAGALLGISGGILYNYFLILGLNTIWQDAVNTSLLVTKINITTLLAGSIAGIITSMAVLLFILWKNLRKPLSVIVKSENGIRNPGNWNSKFILNVIAATICFGVAVALIMWTLITGKSLDSSFSLLAGSFILPGGWALLNLILIKRSEKRGKSIPGFLQLTLKNLSLNRSRTISTVALLSLGTFTIIITGANRKTFYGTETNRQSGTGGFLLWAESTLPIMDDLNSLQGSNLLGPEDDGVLKPVHFIQLSSLEGDDASCLNLNQVSQPGMLGIPATLFNRFSAFSFTTLVPTIDKTHPWKALSISLGSDIIPGFADQTVITWGLHKSVGDTLVYRDESGKSLKIKLIGGLNNSIFQGNILVSDSLLRLFYPSISGSRIMLVDGPANQRDTIAHRLETLFLDYGLMATPASERLASFNAVENAYLSVFMLLGGLGVIIGTIGLGIVLLRNIFQRNQELALYHALGFQKRSVFMLILAEHSVILISGVLLGLISALPGILPLLITPANTVPFLVIAVILILVLTNGCLWIYFPARKIIYGNPISGLRTE